VKTPATPGAFRALALSLVALALSLGAALVGAQRDGLYADPGRLEAPAAIETAAAR
jgi:hypothetical protein